MPYTPLPTPPSREDAANFAARADAFLGAMPGFGTEMNNLADDASESALIAQQAAASAINSPATSATSTTTLAIGLGARTLNIQTGKAFVVGQVVQIAESGNPAGNWMHGAITAYSASSGVLSVMIDLVEGGGTFSGWTISVSAPVQRSGTINLDDASTVADATGNPFRIGYRIVPLKEATAVYTLDPGDAGKCIKASADLTVPTDATKDIEPGSVFSFYNNTGATLSVTAMSGVTLRLGGGTTVGNRSVARRGWGSLMKVGPNEWVIQGSGVS